MSGWTHYGPGSRVTMRATPEGKANDRPERVPYHWREHGMPEHEVQARIAAAKARARAIHGVEEEA